MNIVATTQRRPGHEWFTPYSNAPTTGGFAIARIQPTASLEGLAKWLSETVPVTHRRRGSLCVRVYLGWTKGEELRRQVKAGHWRGVALFSEDRISAALKDAENAISVYGLDDEPAMIQDWDFHVLGPDETADEFWQAEAAAIVAAGAVRVSVDYAFDPRKTFEIVARPSEGQG